MLQVIHEIARTPQAAMGRVIGFIVLLYVAALGATIIVLRVNEIASGG